MTSTVARGYGLVYKNFRRAEIPAPAQAGPEGSPGTPYDGVLVSASGPTVYTTGSWRPFPGQEDAFLAAWEEFARWAATLPGAAEPAILASDVRDEGRYVSFVGWKDM